MLFVFLTLATFFGVFFWNADKLNKTVQRNDELRRATNRGIGMRIEL